MAEWSKALVSSTNISGCVGSNPTAVKVSNNLFFIVIMISFTLYAQKFTAWFNRMRCVEDHDQETKETCAICFEDLAEAPTQSLPCSHTFHRACVNRIRMTIGVQQACPICRKRLPPSAATLIARAWGIFLPIQNRVINGAILTRRERQQMNEVVGCWEEAAEQGNNIGQLHMAILYKHGLFLERNYDAAAELFTKAATQGDAEAQHYLAMMHYFGQSVERNIHTAIKWFTVAAEKGLVVESHMMLGRIYYHGHGVRTNYKKAFRWYERPAMEANNPEAQDVLGTLYHYGWGVKKSHKKAYQWFNKGATNGDSNAQFNLGDMYYYGKYVKKNDAKAIKWYEKAVDQGHDNAKRRLDRIRSRQRKEQLILRKKPPSAT